MEILKSNNCFVYWDYSKSLGGEVLLRSYFEKSPEYKQDFNIDIIFSNVFYIDTKLKYYGLTLSLPPKEVITKLQMKLDLKADCFFEITSESRSFYIGADTLSVYVNDIDMYQSSLNWGMNRGHNLLDLDVSKFLEFTTDNIWKTLIL